MISRKLAYTAIALLFLVVAVGWVSQPLLTGWAVRGGLYLMPPSASLQPEATPKTLKAYERLYMEAKWHCSFDYSSITPKNAPYVELGREVVDGETRVYVPKSSIVTIEHTVYVLSGAFGNSTKGNVDVILMDRRVFPIKCEAAGQNGNARSTFVIDQIEGDDISSGFLKTKDFGNIVVVQGSGWTGMPGDRGPQLIDIAVESHLKSAFERYLSRKSREQR